MTSKGLVEMFEGDSADMCRWGAERRVSRAQTRERGPPSALAELQYFSSPKKHIAFIPGMSFLNTYFVWVLLLLWPLQSNSYSGAEKFDPEKYIPVEHHFIPNCGSGPDPVPEVSDDYYENYDDDDGGGEYK